MEGINLEVEFASATIRNLALAAVKDLYGEDGWWADPNSTRASIICCRIDDAVATWAQLLIGFAKMYKAVLEPADAIATYKEA